MNCTNPVTLKSPDKVRYPAGLIVPCGKCLSCRIAKRKEWSIRLLNELEYHKKAVFVTLTYRDECMPQNGSLKKVDMQNFIKRLRKYEKIKYYLCGEYGPKTERPHYHAIIFGLGLWKQDKELIIRCWQNMDWTVPVIRRKAFGLVERESIEYVTGYIHDKLSGELAFESYAKRGREAVFRLLSQGLGKQYCLDQADKLKSDLCVTVGGIKYAIPRYYLSKLKIDSDTLAQRALIRDAEITAKYTGLHVPIQHAVDCLTYDEWSETKHGVKKAREQRDRTNKAKCNLRSKRL